MRRRLFHLVGVAILVASSVVAQDMTWNGAASDNEWYAFNAVPDTWNPQVWVNNWGGVIYRYPDDPAPTEMTTPTGTATIPTGYVADVETQVQVSSVQLGGTLEIGAQLSCATLNVAGETRLTVDSDVTLSGAGWVETSDAADNEIGAFFSGDHRLTNQSTIYAAGRIGGNTIAVTNQGLIVADRPTMLTVDPTDTPLDGQPGVVNQGTLRAADGGTLSLVRGSFANAGGVVEALDGSVVELGRAASLSGGQLQTAGSGVIRSSHDVANTTTDPQVRDLTVTGTLQVPDGKRLEAAGTLTVNGQLRLDAAGGIARLGVESSTSCSATESPPATGWSIGSLQGFSSGAGPAGASGGGSGSSP